MFLRILIESQWNLNDNTSGRRMAEDTILIESQWNLNTDSDLVRKIDGNTY